MSETDNKNCAEEKKKSRYLIFKLNQHFFAIPLMEVKEVLELPFVQYLPEMPTCFKGIINLRGSIISIIDTHLIMGLSSSTADKSSLIISDISKTMIGLIVDDIVKVEEFARDEIKGGHEQVAFGQDFISGVFSNPSEDSQEMILILNTEFLIKNKLNLLTSKNVA